jgi:dipeptidyl aminopeptidase/acylaminoacyl peptidase
VLLVVALAALVAAAGADGVANGTLLEATAVQPADGGSWDPALARVLDAVDVSRIVYSSDGLKVRGYLANPKRAERLPAVILNRGGNREFGALTDEAAVGSLGSLAAKGYVVVASQYRGCGGSEGQEEWGGADVGDVLNLIPLIESLPQADPTRIGMVGWSRGGMMTYLALARTDRIAAAIAGSAVTDLAALGAARPDMEEVFRDLIPGYRERRQEALDARSAVRWPEKLCKQTPVLILAGSADWRVDPQQALDMAGALLQAQHPFRLVLLEGGDHGLGEHHLEVQRLVEEWLGRYLRDRTPWPSLEPHGE